MISLCLARTWEGWIEPWRYVYFYDHGCTQRYKLNVKESGIRVYGEGKLVNIRSSFYKIFKLGPNKVKEHTNYMYDHVGFMTCLFKDDVSSLEERHSEVKHNINALSSPGIRRKDLAISTCCLMFWLVVVQIAMFGSGLVYLNDIM